MPDYSSTFWRRIKARGVNKWVEEAPMINKMYYFQYTKASQHEYKCLYMNTLMD